MLNYKYNTELQHVDNTASNTSQVDIELEDIDLSTDIKTMLNAENPISNSTTYKILPKPSIAISSVHSSPIDSLRNIQTAGSACSNQSLIEMEIGFHRNLLNVKEHLDILTLNIQAQVDQDRNTQILQNLADPSSQPSAISTPTLGCSVLIDRQQPSHRFILVSTTKSFNHRSNEVPNVSLASATEESNRPWRRMPECAICIQLGHMAQTGPRRYTAQPPSQLIRSHAVYKSNQGYERLELIPRIIPRSHDTTPNVVPEPRNRMTEAIHTTPRDLNTELAPVPEPETFTVENSPDHNPRRRTFLRHCSNCKGLSHNILQCPSLPCMFCNKLGHVSADCPTRQSINRESHRKSKAKSRAKRSQIICQRKNLERWHDPRESPSKGEASASLTLATAADQPVRIEGEIDVEMAKDQIHDPGHGTSYTNAERVEDMEVDQ